MTEIRQYLDHANENPGNFARITKLCLKRVEEYCAKVEAGELLYDQKEVKRVINFLERLRHQGGERLKLLDWQKFLLACIYGFRHHDGRIVFNSVFLFIAKKNGKTALSSGLALYRFATKPTSRVYLTATDYEQAKIAHEDIESMIRGTPALAQKLAKDSIKIRELPTPMIAWERKKPNSNEKMVSRIKIIPETRAKSAQGRRPDFILFDEIASYTTSEIIQKLSSGIIDPNTIKISLTTAETNMDNPGYFEYIRARNVLTGKEVATNYLPLIYELDPGDDKWDETKYIKANPSLDKIKPLWKPKEDRDQARQSPIDEAAFFAYHLNIWSSAPQADIPDDLWQQAIDQASKYARYLTEEKLAQYPAFAAIDLSKIDDYTAYTIVFYIQPLGKFYQRHKFYLPSGQIERRFARESEQLRLWIRDGWVTPTIDGNSDLTINYDTLRDDVVRDWERYKGLLGIAYDPAFSRAFMRSLESIRTSREIVFVDFPQTWKHTAPANKEWFNAVLQGKIIDANPVMRWMVGNVKRKEDRNGNISFVKANYAQSNLRIDGVDTAVMAYAMLQGQLEQGIGNIEDQVRGLAAIDY